MFRKKHVVWCAMIGVISFSLSSRVTEAGCTVGAANRRVSSTQKGSVLIYSKVEIKWDATGRLIQDTFLDISNDYPADVYVQGFFVNGDMELEEVLDQSGAVLDAYEPGWNTADCRFELTANQPHYWSAARGSDKCQAFTALDDNGPGRPDPETGGHILRGFAIFFAIDFIETAGEFGRWKEIHWNHLKGDAVIVNYANSSAWEYNAWAFQAIAGSHGTRTGGAGEIDLDGIEFEYAYDSLILDFYASGSFALSGGSQSVMVDTDLTLVVVDIDLQQDGAGPKLTKVEAEIWNEFESKFSGTRRCICCWDQTMLSDWVRSVAIPNHFMRNELRTDKGKARLDGVASTECDYLELCGPTAFQKVCLDDDFVDQRPCLTRDKSENVPILGLATKFLAFSPSERHETAGINLVGAGTETGEIEWDLEDGPPEAHGRKGGVSRGDIR